MNDSKPVLGFIGLGQMGLAIVTRLLECGYTVNVLGNRSRQPIDIATSLGAIEHTSPATLGPLCDIVFVCVSTSAQVESRILGADGLINYLRPNSLVVDLGTSEPASTLKIGNALAKVGVEMLDAPLGRTPSHALQGKLNIMAAGTSDTFERAFPVFKVMGENVYHVGPLTTGHKIKLINNFFAMTTAAAMAEAYAAADAVGLDRITLEGVMSSGPAHSQMMDFISAQALHNDPYLLGFAIKNAQKDLTYYNTMVKSHGAPQAVASATLSALSDASDTGFSDKNIPELVNYFSSSIAKP